MTRITLLTFTTCGLLSIALTGCPQGEQKPAATDSPSPSKATDAHDHHHLHPTEGPHHGELIELGNENYHAELLHSDAEVTIYILDGAAKTAVPIDSESIAINLLHDGSPEQYTLEASPVEGDPKGRSSRFVSSDSNLMTRLDEEHQEFRLVVTIEGKSYNGRFEHSHADHGDHDHDHSP